MNGRTRTEAGTYRAAVDADAATAQALGARGVPFTVINDRYVVPGALETADLVRVLDHVAAG